MQGEGVPPAFLFAVALAHPVVYSYFRILRSKKRKLYEKVWKKMRGCRGRRKEPFLKRFFLFPLQNAKVYNDFRAIFTLKLTVSSGAILRARPALISPSRPARRQFVGSTPQT